jgi:hypothetical protein
MIQSPKLQELNERTRRDLLAFVNQIATGIVQLAYNFNQ